ncbi:NACHT domain-containing protein [Streptomyces sp. NPDC050704]|uniref:NACHT domain-containing protein n=1 Tax=Streptomyces sp. NPDC050704 TaxID=3157219 RepID=UPI0034313953
MGTVAVGFAVWLLAGGPSEPLTAVAGLFVGVASLLLSLVDFFRQDSPPPDPAEYADDLARTLRAQWLEEAEARRLRAPRVLPLAWATTTRQVADEPQAEAAGGRVVRVRLDGRLDGRFEAVTDQLARGYRQLPQERLVVIGEPGAGKTVLALLLTLGLLDAREPGGRVPVLLPVSSWDPVRERLDDWIVRTLAVPYYNGRPEIPRALLAHGLLLPVLDGLDEIPESARRGAIRAINRAVGAERPVVVTCRAVEYEELIRGGAPTLRRTPVVEVAPVPPEDVIGYLRDVDWPDDAVWDGVFARLRAEPDGPVAEALSTPLMVTTARLVYQSGTGRPAELLDAERFDCRYAVEDHLTHQVVEAAYASEDAEERGRWSADQARRWLTFLACYLHDHRERDLAWWLMSGRLLPTWAPPVLGLVVGAAVAGGAVAWTEVTGVGVSGAGGIVLLSMGIAVLFALVGSLVWYAAGDRSPGRLSWSLRGSTGRLRRGFRYGVVLCAVSVGPVAVGWTAFRVLTYTSGPGTLQSAEELAKLVLVCVSLCAVTGLALAVHSWLNAPPSRATQVSPANSLAQDRRSALTGALAAGAVFGAAGVFGLQAGLLAGGLVFRLANGWPGWPGDGDASDYVRDEWSHTDRSFGVDGLGFGLPLVLPAVLFTLFVLLSRAWPRFLLTRIWLAARGRLPWRLFTFLAEARRREILRQSGDTYQFRHIRLQEALAGQPTYADVPPLSQRAATTRTVRRRLVLAAGAAVALTGGGVAIRRHRDESTVVFSAPHEAPMTAVAFRPRTDELVWGDTGGRLWWGSRFGGERQVLGPVHLSKADQSAGVDPGVTKAAFHPDGSTLAVGRGGRLRLWNARRPSQWGDFPESAEVQAFLSIAFAPPGQGGYLACAPVYRPPLYNGALYVGRVTADGRLEDVSPAKGPGDELEAVAVAFLRRGGLAVLGSDDEVYEFTAPKFRKGSRIEKAVPDRLGGGTLADVVASPYDDLLLLLRHDADSGLWRLGAGGKWHRTALPAALEAAFHPRRPLLALVPESGISEDLTNDGTIELWSTGGPLTRPSRLKQLHGHMGGVTCLDFSPDGRWLVSAGSDGTVRLWDVGDTP